MPLLDVDVVAVDMVLLGKTSSVVAVPEEVSSPEEVLAETSSVVEVLELLAEFSRVVEVMLSVLV